MNRSSLWTYAGTSVAQTTTSDNQCMTTRPLYALHVMLISPSFLNTSEKTVLSFLCLPTKLKLSRDKAFGELRLGAGHLIAPAPAPELSVRPSQQSGTTRGRRIAKIATADQQVPQTTLQLTKSFAVQLTSTISTPVKACVEKFCFGDFSPRVIPLPLAAYISPKCRLCIKHHRIELGWKP